MPAARFLRRLVALVPGFFIACSGRGTVIESRREPPPSSMNSPDGGGHLVAEPGLHPIPGSEAGADAATDDELTPKSGSRVTISGTVADGEILDFGAVEDKQRGVRCSVVNGADGVSRCLPFEGDVVFGDAACTNALMRNQQPSSCPSHGPAYVSYAPASACAGAKMRVLQVGALVDEPSQLYNLDPDTGACRDEPKKPDNVYYATSPSPASDWVSFERKLVKVTPQLGVEVWIGQDGSRLPGDYRLLPEDIACEPLGSGGYATARGPNHCIPMNRAHEAQNAFYLDSACTDYVTVGMHTCNPPTISDHPVDSSTCSGQRYFELGRQVDPGSLYWQIPGELKGQSSDQAPCQRTVASFLVNSNYYVIGAPIDVARYPTMTLEAQGSSRIRPYYWMSEGRKLLPTPHPGAIGEDTKLGLECYSRTFSDGIERCLPATGSNMDNVFADVSCKQELFEYQSPAPGTCVGFDAITPVWVEDPNGPAAECGVSSVGQLRPVLGEHQGPIYQFQESGACKLLTPSDYPTNPQSVFTFYDVGGPVDPTTLFAEVKSEEL